MTAPAPSSRDSLRQLHRTLVAGLVAFWIVIGVFTYAGVVPLTRDAPFPPSVMVAICGAVLLVAVLWARPRVPARSASTGIDDYFRDERVRAGVNFVIFLLDGSATLVAVWTLLTGSWMTAVVSLVSIVIMAFNGPERFERSVDGLEP